MIIEALGTAFIFLVLGLIGLGPALFFIPASKKRLGWALGISPAVGYMLIALFAFPLARYIGPVEVWARSFTLIMAILSLALIYRDWRRYRQDYHSLLDRRSLLRNLLFLVGCYLVLVAPLIFKGIEYAVFRSNPADAYMYVSLAESLRIVEWDTIMGGVRLSTDNMEGIKHLAEVSPTALYSARHIAKPLPMSGPATLAWAAALTGNLPYRFQHAYHLTIFLIAACMALVLADRLHASFLMRYLAAAVVAFGFWAHFVLNTDSSFQITSIPLLLLLAFAWILVEDDPRLWTQSRILLGVTGGITLWFYFPLVAVVAVAGLFYYGVGLVQRDRTVITAAYHGITLAIGVLALTLTGQIDFAYRNVLYLIAGARTEGQFFPKALQVILNNGVASFWGFPAKVIAHKFPSLWQTVVLAGIEFFGLVLLLLFVITVVIVFLRRFSVAERVVGAMAMSGLFLLFILYVLGSRKPAGQAFTYTYAFFILFGILYAQVFKQASRLPIRNIASVVVVMWLIGQGLLGAVIPYSSIDHSVIPLADVKQRSRYEIDDIRCYLDKQSVHSLLVSVPDSDRWWYTMYLQFAFAPYHPYFQSGILIDNSTDFRNIWLDNARSSYRYAVVAKDADYIGFDRMGRVVAKAPGLLLYELTNYNATAVAKQEDFLRQKEMANPPFPSLLLNP